MPSQVCLWLKQLNQFLECTLSPSPPSPQHAFQRKSLFEIEVFEMCLWHFEYKHSLCATYRRPYKCIPWRTLQNRVDTHVFLLRNQVSDIPRSYIALIYETVVWFLISVCTTSRILLYYPSRHFILQVSGWVLFNWNAWPWDTLWKHFLAPISLKGNPVVSVNTDFRNCQHIKGFWWLLWI